jgi:hypothetical protein
MHVFLLFVFTIDRRWIRRRYTPRANKCLMPYFTVQYSTVVFYLYPSFLREPTICFGGGDRQYSNNLFVFVHRIELAITTTKKLSFIKHPVPIIIIIITWNRIESNRIESNQSIASRRSNVHPIYPKSYDTV